MKSGSSREALKFVWQPARPRRRWTARTAVWAGAVVCAGLGYFATRSAGISISDLLSLGKGGEPIAVLDADRGRDKVVATLSQSGSSQEQHSELAPTPPSASTSPSIAETAKVQDVAPMSAVGVEASAPAGPDSRNPTREPKRKSSTAARGDAPRAARPAPEAWQPFDFPLKVDPSGKAPGYWNGRSFN